MKIYSVQKAKVSCSREPAVKLTHSGSHQPRLDPSQEDWPAPKRMEIQNVSFMSQRSDASSASQMADSAYLLTDLLS